MTLEEIKAAVNAGKTVHWATYSYEVVKGHEPAVGRWFIVCTDNDSTIGLTHRDEVTMNGEPEQFFINQYLPDRKVK
jgi:hypothetical protein